MGFSGPCRSPKNERKSQEKNNDSSGSFAAAHHKSQQTQQQSRLVVILMLSFKTIFLPIMINIRPEECKQGYWSDTCMCLTALPKGRSCHHGLQYFPPFFPVLCYSLQLLVTTKFCLELVKHSYPLLSSWSFPQHSAFSDGPQHAITPQCTTQTLLLTSLNSVIWSVISFHPPCLGSPHN